MRIFLDSANIDEIARLNETGLIDGVTTNPSIIAKSGRKYSEVIKEICQVVDGPISAEVIATEFKEMLKEAEYLGAIHPNVTIKLPLTFDGLRACHYLSGKRISVNMTLCFSPTQALFAAKAGAEFISPFVGRIDDIGGDGMGLIEDIVKIYSNYPHFKTQILCASIRSVEHVTKAARLGADIVTIPPVLFDQLYTHSLTDKGLKIFMDEWTGSGSSFK